MKNIKLSTALLCAVTTFSYAGGDISPITYYETSDVTVAEDVYVEQPVQEVYTSEPIEEYTSAPMEVYTSTPVEEYSSAPIEVVAPTPLTTSTIEAKPVVVDSTKKRGAIANGFYAGLGLTTTRYETNCGSSSTGNIASCKKSGDDITFGALGRVGYDFNRYIGVELRALKTTFGDDGGTVRHNGVFLKPMLPVGDAMNMYALVGFAKTEIQGSLQHTDAEALALGLGVEIDLSEDDAKDAKYGRTFDGVGDQEQGVGVFVDYERMVVKSGSPDLDALSAGVTYDF